jgi:hypothetical protein
MAVMEKSVVDDKARLAKLKEQRESLLWEKYNVDSLTFDVMMARYPVLANEIYAEVDAQEWYLLFSIFVLIDEQMERLHTSDKPNTHQAFFFHRFCFPHVLALIHWLIAMHVFSLDFSVLLIPHRFVDTGVVEAPKGWGVLVLDAAGKPTPKPADDTHHHH